MTQVRVAVKFCGEGVTCFLDNLVVNLAVQLGSMRLFVHWNSVQASTRSNVDFAFSSVANVALQSKSRSRRTNICENKIGAIELTRAWTQSHQCHCPLRILVDDLHTIRES